MEDEEWCAMDEKLDLKDVFSALFLRIRIVLKMEGRSIYTHSWTCTDNCLIR